MSRPLNEILTVFMDGEFVPGVMLYGLDSNADDGEPCFPYGAWPWLAGLKTFVLGGEHWRVRLWEIALPEIPSPELLWDATATTLGVLIDAGCLTAWPPGWDWREASVILRRYFFPNACQAE